MKHISHVSAVRGQLVRFIGRSFQTTQALRSGASGLPYYCAPLVCVSAVMELLAVWWHNNQKPKKPRCKKPPLAVHERSNCPLLPESNPWEWACYTEVPWVGQDQRNTMKKQRNTKLIDTNLHSRTPTLGTVGLPNTPKKKTMGSGVL